MKFLVKQFLIQLLYLRFLCLLLFIKELNFNTKLRIAVQKQIYGSKQTNFLIVVLPMYKFL